GPNGAGKTTLLLILAGLLAPDSGEASVAGFDPVTQPYEVHRVVGWMPDFFGVYDGLTSREYLDLFGATFSMTLNERSIRVEELVADLDLGTFADNPIHTLSRGQKQRLGFARAIVHRPSLLLLDEPASGLDPRARIDLRDLLLRLKGEGVSIVISSHILSELEEMADDVAFVDAGRSRGLFPLSDLPRGAALASWRISALQLEPLVAALQSNGTPFTQLVGASVEVHLENEQMAAALITQLVGQGVQVTEVIRGGSGLEQAFMALESEAAG
ncbi:MAG TPA: ABC transporter ATP-binding protein, partial [Actinomycetota bacterium]|nr:ABC transporter ATP-binding protein [Actinomycetota bacterium]